jgi:KDO2-lipid IV(A) lauroyltransferase
LRLVLPLLLRVLSRVPLGWLHAVGSVLGWCIYWFSPRYAQRMKTNLSTSGIARDPSSSRRLLHAAIAQNGKALTELPVVWFRDDDAAARLVIECRGWERIDSLRREGRSIIFLSPHMGCFEIAARYVAGHFPLTVMYRPQRAAWLDSLMESGRTNKQLELAPTNFKGVRMLSKALRRGESIGLLPDHAPGLGEGVWANFFGTPAFTMTLPRKLQRASGAALMITFGERLPRGKGFRLHFEPLREHDFNEEKLNLAIEDLVRRFPEQYYWNYNRYKGMSRRLGSATRSRRA